MNKLLTYLSLVKFAHTIFSLPFAVTGFLMAIRLTGNVPEISVMIAVLLCLVFARNAAMSFNRWTDRLIDAHNPRTKSREIPTKTISHKSALGFTLINALLFVVSAYFINLICFVLSPLALLVILGYSYTKRISWLCHFVLGLALMIAPVGAFMAVAGIITLPIFLLGLTVMFWVAGFDILYSLQDTQFDHQHGLHSVPAKFGVSRALKISRISHMLSSTFFILWYFLLENHGDKIFILAGIILFIAFLIRQHLIIRGGKHDHINRVFFVNNGIASVLFCVFYVMNYFFHSIFA
jgi:4-hydroxybenzoate polyprenyltransferase